MIHRVLHSPDRDGSSCPLRQWNVRNVCRHPIPSGCTALSICAIFRICGMAGRSFRTECGFRRLSVPEKIFLIGPVRQNAYIANGSSEIQPQHPGRMVVPIQSLRNSRNGLLSLIQIESFDPFCDLAAVTKDFTRVIRIVKSAADKLLHGEQVFDLSAFRLGE